MSTSDAYSLQSTFLGDVLFTSSTVVALNMTVAGPTSYNWTETFAAGTWFATPLHLVQYMITEWNADHTGAMSATLEADPDHASYGKILITPDAGFGVISALTFAIGDTTIAAECGFTFTSQDFGAVGSTPFYTTNAVTYILTPHWPLHAYNREVRATSGYADMAHDGTVYSFAGHWREFVNLGVTLDRRDSDFTEFTAWRLLWNKRWGAGRVVVMYLDRENIQTTFSFGDELEEADPLVVESSPEAVRARRLIDWKEYADQMDTYSFAIRRPLPDTTPSENQAAYIL